MYEGDGLLLVISSSWNLPSWKGSELRRAGAIFKLKPSWILFCTSKPASFYIIFSSPVSFWVLLTQIKCNFECVIQVSRGPGARILGLCHGQPRIQYILGKNFGCSIVSVWRRWALTLFSVVSSVETFWQTLFSPSCQVSHIVLTWYYTHPHPSFLLKPLV